MQCVVSRDNAGHIKIAIPMVIQVGRRLVTTDLDAQRWGPGIGDDTASISIPADRWDWEVANWPHNKWLAWHHRASELAPPGSSVEQIREGHHLAYLEIIDDGA
jgi:hypothetical protein